MENAQLKPRRAYPPLKLSSREYAKIEMLEITSMIKRSKDLNGMIAMHASDSDEYHSKFINIEKLHLKSLMMIIMSCL